MSFDYAMVFRAFKAPKKCPNCKKKGHMKAIKAEKTTQVDAGELWFEVPYYICNKCKTGLYDYRAFLMETVAVDWIQNPDAEGTWH